MDNPEKWPLRRGGRISRKLGFWEPFWRQIRTQRVEIGQKWGIEQLFWATNTTQWYDASRRPMHYVRLSRRFLFLGQKSCSIPHFRPISTRWVRIWRQNGSQKPSFRDIRPPHRRGHFSGSSMITFCQKTSFTKSVFAVLKQWCWWP